VRTNARSGPLPLRAGDGRQTAHEHAPPPDHRSSDQDGGQRFSPRPHDVRQVFDGQRDLCDLVVAAHRAWAPASRCGCLSIPM